MEATTHVAVGRVPSWFCCCFASKPASVDVEGDVRILVGHKFAIDKVLKESHEGALLWLDQQAVVRKQGGLRLSVRLQPDVYHLLLSAAAPARCTQTQQGRYTLITWPSDAALLPVRNAQRLLLPRVNDLLGHAETMSSCGFQLVCTAVGFVIRDTISGNETHLTVGPGNAGLLMTLGSSSRAEPMHNIKHVMDFLHMQRQAASSLRDVPAVVPVDRGVSLHGVGGAVACLPQGIDASIPASSSVPACATFGIGASGGEPARHAADVLQPATCVFDSMELAEVLSSVMERQGGGDPAWAAELAEQRIVHAIILKLHLQAEADSEALLASPSGDAHLEDFCRSMAGFYSGNSAVSMPYSVSAVFVGCSQLASRGSGTQRAALMRASVYQLAVPNASELAPMDPRLAAKDGGSSASKVIQWKSHTIVPSRPFVAIPELDEDPAPVSENLELSAELPAAKQPPSEASRSLAHTLTRSLLHASASSMHQGDGALTAEGVCGSPAHAASLKASGMVTPRVSHVMLNGAEPDVLVRLDCDTSQSSTDVEKGAEDAPAVPPAFSPTQRRATPSQGFPSSPGMSSIPKLRLRGLASAAGDQFSASSSRQARRWLNGSASLTVMDAQRSLADGMASDVLQTQSNGTPPAERRTPVKVPLPMLLDQRLPNLGTGDVRTVSEEKALHAIASAQALVLSSLAGILRMVRGDKACGMRGLRLAHVPVGGQVSARSHTSAAAAALPSARSFGGVLCQDDTLPGFILDPVVSKALLWGQGKGTDAAVARAAALSAAVLMLSDGATVPPSAPPANAEAAARTVMRLMNTTRPRDTAVGLSLTALRQVLVRVLLLLCQGPMVMEPMSRTLVAAHERWMPPPSQRHSAKVLRQLPFAIGHRMHVLASRLESGGDASAARAACACLQLTSMLIACDSSATVQGAVFKACIEPMERIADAISGSTVSPPKWNDAYLALMEQLVDTLSRTMRSPLLPDVVGQRLISLFAVRQAFLNTVLKFTRAVLFDDMPSASQLRILDLWSSYAQLVSRQPDCMAPGDMSTRAVSLAHGTSGRSDMHQATVSTLNVPIGGPLAPPVERVGRDTGAADIISEWSPIPEGGQGSTEGLMALESLRIDESLLGVNQETHSVTRAAALQVLQPLVDLPLGVLMRLLHTPALPAEVQLGALSTLREVYACHGCPFVASEDLADRYIQIHYVMFLKLYLLPQQPLADGQDPPLSARSLNSSVRSASSAGDSGSSRRGQCLAHLHVLIALAGHKHKHVQQLFQRHKVLQFLAAELSLEFHAKRHGNLSHLRTHSAHSGREPQWSASTASQMRSQDSDPSSRHIVPSSAQKRSQGRSGSCSSVTRRPASGRQDVDTVAWHRSSNFSATEEAFLSPLSSVESRQHSAASRPVSAQAALKKRCPSRASTPTAGSQGKATMRTPPLRQLSGASGINAATPRGNSTQSSWRPPSARRRLERSEPRGEGLLLSGVDSRAASNSSSVSSTPRLPERRTSGRISTRQPCNDTGRNHPVGQRALRPRTANQRLQTAPVTEATTAETSELHLLPLRGTADHAALTGDVLAEGEIETRELSPLGRLPPTPDGSSPYDVAHAVAFAATSTGDEGRGARNRISKPQPMSESMISASNGLGTLHCGDSSFSVDSMSSWEQRMAVGFSSAYQSTVPQPTGRGVRVPVPAVFRCIAPTVKPPSAPQSLDFLERCNAVKEQYLRHPLERRTLVNSGKYSTCIPRRHMQCVHAVDSPVAASGTRTLDPGREIDPAYKHPAPVTSSYWAAEGGRSTVPKMYPQPEALGEGQQGQGSASSVDAGPLSMQSFEPHFSSCTPRDLSASATGKHRLPASRQEHSQRPTCHTQQHSGDLGSVGSAVLEPNAVNGPGRSSSSQPTLDGVGAVVAFLVPVRGADGAPATVGADGNIPYCLTFGGLSQTVLLTGDMDDDLDVLEELEEELGVQVQVQGLAAEDSDAGYSSVSSLDSESGGRSLGGLSYSPSMLSRKARRNAAGLRSGEVHSHGSPLLARAGPLQSSSSQPVQLRLPMGGMPARSTSTTPVSHSSPPDANSMTGAASQTASPEHGGMSPASPAVPVPRPVPRLSLQDVDVVALRANIEADAAAIQDDSLMLEPGLHCGMRAAPGGGVSSAPPVFLSPPTSRNEQGNLGPLSAFEGSAIHAARGAHFKSQRVYAQRSVQHARAVSAGCGHPVLATATASASTMPVSTAQTPTSSCADFDYDIEASSRLLYRDADIHLAMLTLVITLLLSADGQLDPVHSPSEYVALGAAQRSHDADLCTVMYHHLNHIRNRGVLPGLLQAAHSIGTPAVRLLKLLVHDLYSEDLLTGKPETFARGTFALVQKRRACVVAAQRDSVPHHVAEKVIERPTQADSQLQLGDILMEVSIMERFSECAGVCRLLDYGVTRDGFHIVMPLYKCNLADWRAALPHDLSSCLGMQRLFINVFRQEIGCTTPCAAVDVSKVSEHSACVDVGLASCHLNDAQHLTTVGVFTYFIVHVWTSGRASSALSLMATSTVRVDSQEGFPKNMPWIQTIQVVDALATLQAGNVVHFDLKPQNVYLEPLPGTRDVDFWMPPTEAPTFRVIIGDFGESKMFPPESSSHTLRPLGTDFMKSPEMLRNGQHTALHQQRENFDRRRHKGAGPPSDVWALACVLYQLIFGEMLFFDPDYFRFLQRVGFGTGPTIQQPAAGKLSRTPAVARLVSLMTERNQEARIDLRKVQAKLQDLVVVASAKMGGGDVLPVYRPPRLADAVSSPSSAPQVAAHIHNPELDAAAAFVTFPGLPVVASAVCGAANNAYAAGTVQLTPSVLLGPAAACRCVSGLSAAALQCIIVVSASAVRPQGHGAKGHWMDLAAALEVPLLHVAERGMSVEALEGLQDDAQCYEKVLVVWEPGVWPHAAMVAVALAMHKHDMLCCMALTRLRRCTLFGKLSKEQVSVLHSIRT